MGNPGRPVRDPPVLAGNLKGVHIWIEARHPRREMGEAGSAFYTLPFPRGHIAPWAIDDRVMIVEGMDMRGVSTTSDLQRGVQLRISPPSSLHFRKVTREQCHISLQNPTDQEML